MNRSFRGISIGILSGAVASTALIATLHYGVWSLILGVAVGVAYSAAFPPTQRAYVDNLMAGGSLGVPLWGLISVMAVPLLSPQMPEWGPKQFRQHFPALVRCVCYTPLPPTSHPPSPTHPTPFFSPSPTPQAPPL